MHRIQPVAQQPEGQRALRLDHVLVRGGAVRVEPALPLQRLRPQKVGREANARPRQPSRLRRDLPRRRRHQSTFDAVEVLRQDPALQGGQRAGDDLRRLHPKLPTDEAAGNDRIPGGHRQTERRAFHRRLAKLQATLGFPAGDAGELGDELNPVAASVLISQRSVAEVGLRANSNVGGRP